MKQRPIRPERVAEHGLTSPVPRWGWSQGRTPMATTAVRCCFHDAEEWLVSWIRTALSDSAWGDSATPGRRNSGRMWNVTEQGHSKGHFKTRHPSPPPSRNLQPRATYGESHAWIYPLFETGVWLRLCLPLREVVVNLQTTMSWFETGNIQAKISEDTLQSMEVSVLSVKSLMSLNCNWSFWLHRSFFTRHLICKVLQTSTAFSSLTHV